MNPLDLLSATGDVRRFMPIAALAHLGGPTLATPDLLNNMKRSPLLSRAIDPMAERLDILVLLLAALEMEVAR